MNKEAENNDDNNKPLNTSVPMECMDKIYLKSEVCFAVKFNIIHRKNI